MNEKVPASELVLQADDPELLCYCKTWTRTRFFDYAQVSPDASLAELCESSGVGMVCTSCLLNAELVFTEARRSAPIASRAKGGTQSAARMSWHWPTKAEIVDWCVRHSPMVPGRFESLSPIVAAPNLETWLHVSNAAPTSIGPRSARFRVEVECRDAEGQVVDEFVQNIDAGSAMMRNLSASLPAGEGLRCGGARITLVARDKNYKGTVRPHFLLRSRDSVAGVHTSNASRGETTPHVFSRRRPGERHFLHVRNGEARPIDVRVETQPLAGGETEIETRRLAPFGAAMIELTATAAPPADALFITRLSANGRQRSYFMCASENLNQISADHV